SIIVAEGQCLRPRQLRPGPKASMRKFIDQNEIPGTREHRDDAGICEIAGTKNASGLGSLEPGESRLKLAKQRMVAGDEPRRARAHAILLDCGRGGRPKLRVMGQVQIIVTGEGE